MGTRLVQNGSGGCETDSAWELVSTPTPPSRSRAVWWDGVTRLKGPITAGRGAFAHTNGTHDASNAVNTTALNDASSDSPLGDYNCENLWWHGVWVGRLPSVTVNPWLIPAHFFIFKEAAINIARLKSAKCCWSDLDDALLFVVVFLRLCCAQVVVISLLHSPSAFFVLLYQFSGVLFFFPWLSSFLPVNSEPGQLLCSFSIPWVDPRFRAGSR